MDSILRNFFDKDWIYNISTVIIDEIHIIGESSRGPRLESLIVRLNEFLYNPQIIGLSATVANPEFFNSWLTWLGNTTVLIKSDKRPVPLHYQIIITKNKDSTIKKIVKSTLEDKGQLLIFVNRRKLAQQIAHSLRNSVKKWIDEYTLKLCKSIEKKVSKVRGYNADLKRTIKHGVAFHHAGLLSKERKLVEGNFNKKILKVICCTTTLSAGINTPARTVIIKDFKKYITSGQNIKDYSGFHENGDGFNYFMPFSSNEVFQMLGRAGRPGLDSIGYGIILVNNIEEKMWIEDNYFQDDRLTPKYSDITSGLNKINVLKEQVLLRIYEEKQITLDKLKQFFKRTFFWYTIQEKTKSNNKNIPIDQLLMIKPITPINILKLHSQPEKISLLKKKKLQISLSKIGSSTITGFVKTSFGVYSCQFDIDTGIQCSCGFQNGLSDNFGNANDEVSFEFCDHITVFLMYLINLPDKNFKKKYVDHIVPRSLKNQHILNYLLEKGLIIQSEKDDTIKCSQFGKKIIRLYLYPASGVLIRDKLENNEISNYRSLIKEA